MWVVISKTLAILFTAAAIKVMDDYFDQEIDIAQGHRNVVQIIGNGAIAYALMAMLAAAILDAKAAVPLFCGAYAVGMGQSLTSGSYRWWGETVLVSAFSAVVAGFTLTLSALLLMLAVQIHDNAVDQEPEAWPLGILLGRAVSTTAAFVCALIFTGLAVALCPLFSLLVVFCYLLFFAFERWCSVCI